LTKKKITSRILSQEIDLLLLFFSSKRRNFLADLKADLKSTGVWRGPLLSAILHRTLSSCTSFVALAMVSSRRFVAGNMSFLMTYPPFSLEL
jgi:hypothetical protein